MNNSTSSALRISACAVLTAITVVFTVAIRIPIAPTRGYLNLGDVAIYFAAFTFGPFTALIAGGVGTGLADLIAGFPQYIPVSMVVHGLQGLLAGLIAGHAAGGEVRGLNPRWLLAGVVGTAVMCLGYLGVEAAMYGLSAALVEAPGNIVQNIAGLAGGIPLALAVRKAYPPVLSLRW